MDNQYQFLSTLEKKVYDWLAKREIPFTTQEPMFGVAGEAGSAVIDFVLTERNIVLRCMGTYWHSSAQSQARDLFGRERLINKGFQVVDIWEESMETDEELEHTMKLALQGQEALR